MLLTQQMVHWTCSPLALSGLGKTDHDSRVTVMMGRTEKPWLDGNSKKAPRGQGPGLNWWKRGQVASRTSVTM